MTVGVLVVKNPSLSQPRTAWNFLNGFHASAAAKTTSNAALTVRRGNIRTSILECGRCYDAPPPLFVLPSQLNGCEYPSHDKVVHEVEDYLYDLTGGPIGQLTCHPALAQAILELGASEAANPGGFHGLRDIPLPKGWVVKNGYLKFGDLSEPWMEAWAEAAPQTRLLVAESVLVQEETGGDTFLVALAYASAAPVKTYLNRSSRADEKEQAAASALLIGVQYLAALRHAAEIALQSGRRRRVVLLPLGAGVFNNQRKHVALALEWALAQLHDEEKKAVLVELLCYEGNQEECLFFEAFFPRPLAPTYRRLPRRLMGGAYWRAGVLRFAAMFSQRHPAVVFSVAAKYFPPNFFRSFYAFSRCFGVL